MLHILQFGSMPNCSKAPRGLFVLLRTDGIFTVNALSPSSSLRQCPHHYAIRAGQNFIDLTQCTSVFTVVRFTYPLCRHRDRTISSPQIHWGHGV